MNSYLRFFTRNMKIKEKKEKELKMMKIKHLKIEVLKNKNYVSQNTCDVFPNLENLLDLKEEKKLFDKMRKVRLISQHYLRIKSKAKYDKKDLSKKYINGKCTKSFMSTYKKKSILPLRHLTKSNALLLLDFKKANEANTELFKNTNKMLKYSHLQTEKLTFKSFKSKKMFGTLKFMKNEEKVTYEKILNSMNNQIKNIETKDFDNYEKYKEIRVIFNY